MKTSKKKVWAWLCRDSGLNQAYHICIKPKNRIYYTGPGGGWGATDFWKDQPWLVCNLTGRQVRRWYPRGPLPKPGTCLRVQIEVPKT